MYTNQSILYSSTGLFSGSVTGMVGSGRYSILCYWLIPNRNTKDGISIGIGWVRGAGVKGRKSLECGSYGRIILGGDGEALVLCMCTGLLCPACGGVVPTAV